MSDIVKRLRQGAGHEPANIMAAEKTMDEAAAEIERLKAENADLRRWKALDKPLTAAMGVVSSDMQKLRAEVERLTAALQRISDKRPATAEMTLAHEMADDADHALEEKK